MKGLRDLTPAERVDRFAADGIELYVVGASLRARCTPAAVRLLEAARPVLAKHRAALVQEIRARHALAGASPRGLTSHTRH